MRASLRPFFVAFVAFIAFVATAISARAGDIIVKRDVYRIAPVVHFADASALLDTDALKVLRDVGAAMRAFPADADVARVVVEGHAGPDGKDPAVLARARADAARAWLVGEGHVDGALLFAV